MAAKQWWIVYELLSIRGPNPAGKTAFKIVQADSADTAKNIVEAEGGIPVDTQGPFSTQAEAQAAASKKETENKNAAHKAEDKKFPHLPNPLGGVEEVGAVLEAAFRTITDVKFWRSLGWLTIGIGLLILGLAIWMKLPQKLEGVAENTAKAAPLLAA